MTSTVNAYGKINPSLYICGARSDGYHELATLMHTIPLCDRVRVDAENGEGIELICNVSALPTDQRNSAFKAARAYLEKGKISARITVSVEKNIPIASGFGGSSTDGAAVLLALNEIFGAFSEDELFAIAAGLSADMPFCLAAAMACRRGYVPFCADCRGIGELISPRQSSLSGLYILLAVGDGDGLSAGEMYKAYDKAPPKLKAAVNYRDVGFYNDFQPLAAKMCKSIPALIDSLYEGGAKIAMLSGSGSGVFALFEREKSACDIKLAINGDGDFCEVYRI